MKLTLHLITLILLVICTSACQKNEPKLKSDFQCTPQNAGHERNDWPVVQVVDGTLNFQSIEQYNQVREWVQSASLETLLAWQQSIGFKSVQYYYHEALNGLCCPDEQADIDQIARDYAGKVLFDTVEKQIDPLLPMTTTGWLTNVNGEFKVGPSLVHYTPDRVISVVDGNQSKMLAACLNPVDNPNNGVYVHPTIAERGCCPVALNAPSVSNGNSSGSKRIKSAWVTNWDESYASYIPQLNTTLYNVIYTFAAQFIHQKKTWLGWTVCQRTYWRYSIGETALITNIPLNCNCLPVGFVNPKVISVNITSGFQCKYHYEQPVFSALNVSPEVYHSIGLCVQKISLNTFATDSGLHTDAKCE
jgi:hypothetical protein